MIIKYCSNNNELNHIILKMKSGRTELIAREIRPYKINNKVATYIIIERVREDAFMLYYYTNMLSNNKYICIAQYPMKKHLDIILTGRTYDYRV